MTSKVFIDGKEGTTGLRIFDRLSQRDDIELIVLSEEERKNPKYRSEAINASDITFLCLPDAAAIDAVSMVKNDKVKIIDTSTAHRTNSNWEYGFPELSKENREKIAKSRRVAVPGCYASGFIALVYPLLKNALISADSKIICHALSGYSGGGKKMIGQYEDNARSNNLDAPRHYALTQEHKHLPEMKEITGLNKYPIFCPIVSDYYSGMVVNVPLFADDLVNNSTVHDIKNLYASIYKGPVVSYCEDIDEDGFVSANSLSGRDSMQISIKGNDERILLISRFDNLGKGASGAALQCMNLMLGKDPAIGLEL